MLPAVHVLAHRDTNKQLPHIPSATELPVAVTFLPHWTLSLQGELK